VKFLDKWWLILVILIGVLFIIASIMFAQQGKLPSPPSASDIVAKMKQELNLNDEQVSQITPVIQSEIQQMQALMEQAKSQGADRDAVIKQMEALRESEESELSQYLTQDQLTQWKNRRQKPLRGSDNKGAGSGEIDTPERE